MGRRGGRTRDRSERGRIKCGILVRVHIEQEYAPVWGCAKQTKIVLPKLNKVFLSPILKKSKRR